MNYINFLSHIPIYNFSFRYFIQFCTYYNFRPNKWYIGLEVQFERGNPDGSTRMTTAYMRSMPVIMMNEIETQQRIEDAVNRLDTLIDTFTNVGSGWTINRLGSVTLHIADYDSIGGSSYIASPAWLSKKKATLNIRNNDEQCFLYCILAVAHARREKCRAYNQICTIPNRVKYRRSNLSHRDWSNSYI